MRDLAGLEITPDEFEALLALCKQDPQFPADWQAWTDLLKTAATAAVVAGSIPTALKMSPQDFEVWCGRVGVVPCIDSIRAYAIIQRSPVAHWVKFGSSSRVS
jgi:hypothetical protein